MSFMNIFINPLDLEESRFAVSSKVLQLQDEAASQCRLPFLPTGLGSGIDVSVCEQVI